MIVVELPGQPVAKGRPRFRTVRGSGTRAPFAMAYTPAKTKAYERALQWQAKAAMGSKKPLDGPLQVTVTAFMEVPASWPRRRRDAALTGAVRPIGRPDYDNIAKAACDALNGIVWGDDSQIVDARIVKTYAEQPLLRIEVAPTDVLA